MDNALYLKSNLINQQGIETEHIMGIYVPEEL